MKYDSTKRVPSKIAPEVVFVLKRMNGYRRDELEEAKRPFEEKLQPLRDQLDALQPQLSPLQARLEPLTKEYRASFERAKAIAQAEIDRLIEAGSTKEEAEAAVSIGALDFPDDQFQEWKRLTKEIGTLQDPIIRQINRIDRQELTPAAVSYVTVSIEGLEIDGQQATVESLRCAGQDDLYAELSKVVARELGLLPEEAANLPSPSTLVGVDEGAKKTNGNAIPVETVGTTIPAGA